MFINSFFCYSSDKDEQNFRSYVMQYWQMYDFVIILVCMLGGDTVSQKKDCRIAMRLSEDLNNEINRTVNLFRDKTKVDVNRTSIITSAIAEGLKVLQQRIDDGK